MFSNSSSKLLMHLLFLALSLALMWGVHLVELSIVSFFHFLLDHRLAVIESWVFDRAWELAVIAKVLPVLFLFKFIYLKSSSRRPFRKQFLKGITVPRSDVFVVIVVSLLLLVIFSRPVLNPSLTQVDVLKVLINYFGLLIFFLSDIFYMDALERMYPLSSKLKAVRNFVYAITFYFMLKSIFLYAQNLDAFYGLTLFFVLSLHDSLKYWSHTALYLSLFLVPALVALGLDFIWGSRFSIFVVEDQIKPVLFFGLYLICIVYIGFSQKQELKKISQQRLERS